MLKHLLTLLFICSTLFVACNKGERKIIPTQAQIQEEELLKTKKSEMYLLIGTYTSDSSKSEGIYVYNFNEESGKSSYVNQVEINNPSYLSVAKDGTRVYAVSENGDNTDMLNALAFDKDSGELLLLNAQPTQGAAPCYVTTDSNGTYVITANYLGGSITVFGTEADGSLLPAENLISLKGKGADKERQSQAHLHTVQYSPDGKFVFATDLGTDKLYKFEVGAANARNYLTLGKPAEFKLKAGSGPRHLVFHPQLTYMYVLTEISGEVVAYHYNDGNLLELQTIEADSVQARGSADIHVSPDGNFLYTSHRIDNDGISIFSIDKTTGNLTKIGYQTTGKHPRNFMITPNGNYLLVACQDSNVIQVYERNLTTGLLNYIEQDIAMDQPVCLKVIQKLIQK